VGEEFGVGLVSLVEPTHGNPLGGLPGGFAQTFGELQDLSRLKDVLVGQEMIEERLAPVVTRLEDLTSQFLDDFLDRPKINRVGDRRQNPAQASVAIAVGHDRPVTLPGPLPAHERLANEPDLASIDTEEP